MKPEDTVRKLLDEEEPVAPVPAVVAPPQLHVYKAVKSEDLELSDELDEFCGEASDTGSTMSIEDLEYISDHQQLFQAEIKSIIERMKAAGANLLILV